MRTDAPHGAPRSRAIALVALLAATAALALTAPAALASSVSGVAVKHDDPSPAAGARTEYDVTFTTSKAGGLSGTDARINVTFPADTAFGGYIGGAVVDVTSTRTVGSCNGPSLGVISCFLFSGEAIGAGDDVRVALSGITNPSKPSAYTLSVSTTADTTVAFSAPYDVVAASPLTITSVAHDKPSPAVSARTVYVVDFTTSKTGGLSRAANSEIKVSFPADTGFTGWTGGTVVDVTSNRSVGSCGSVAAGVVSCFLFQREVIAGGDNVRITVGGVTNPTKPSAYTLGVTTTSDLPDTSPAYDVVAANPLTVTSVAHDKPSPAASARTEYVIRFTTSKTGGLSRAGASEIHVSFPADTSFTGYVGGTVLDVTSNRSVGACNAPVGLAVTCTLFNGESIDPGDDVRLILSGVTNPSRPAAYRLALSTTSDPAPDVTPAYNVVAGGSVSGVKVTHGAPSPAAGARTVYQVDFTTSATGGLSRSANSEITTTFPADTGFTGFTGGTVVDVTNNNRTVGGCSGHTGLAVTCFLFQNEGIAPGDDVRITFTGVTNPSKPSAYTLNVSTTSDAVPTTSAAYDVVAANRLTVTSVVAGSPSPAASARTIYQVGFTTSKTGGLSQAANSQLTVTFPADTSFTGYAGATIEDLTSKRTVGGCNGPNVGVLTCFLFANEAIGAGDDVRMTFSGVTNPTKAGAYTLSVSTTSDTASVVSPAYDIASANPLSKLTLTIDSATPGAETRWVARFTASATGGLSRAANSQITLTFPTGTTFTGFKGGAVFDVTTNTTVGSCNPPNGLTTTCFLFSGDQTGAGDDIRLTFPAITNPPTDGPYTVDVATTSDTTPVTSSPSTVADTTPPQTTIDSGPSGLTNNASPSFGFSSDESGSTFECKLDGPGGATGTFAACSSPRAYTNLADGAYTFSVRATDSSGNTDATPASRSFTIDTSPPQTTIDSGPSGATNDSSPSFAFSSEAGATFSCELDGPGGFVRDPTSCTSPQTYSNLADGDYTLSVSAIDTAGNADPSPATRSFTVDTSAPQTTIDSGPSGLTNDASPSFGFSSEAGATFECKLDGPGAATGTFASCTSPRAFTNLADGTYTFSVRATDTAGNTDSSPATSKFTVDTGAPDTTIDSGPSGPTNDTSPSFGFSSEAGATFQCELDGPGGAVRDPTSCTSPQTYSNLADGDYTLSVRAIDTAGNTDPSPATRSFTVDTAAPDTTIDSGPSGPTNATSPTFGFSSEEGATFECKLDGPGAATGSFAACTSPKDYTNLADGSYTFSVRATDAAGNTDASPATRSFTVDTTAPQTTIDSGPSGTTNDASPSFGFSSEAGATFECKLDGPGAATGSFASCTSPEGFSDLQDGTYTFSTRATDTAGNTDPSPATRTFTVDNAGPQTTIDSGPSGLTNDASPSFAFSSEAGATFECKLDGPGAATGSFASCTSPKDFTNLADGSYTFSVRATDSANNTDSSPATHTFTVDTAAPQTTIDSGPSGLTKDNSPDFDFSSEAGATFECKLDGPGAATGSFAACTSPRDFTHLADGSYTFSVRATDTAGNTDATPATRTFTVDTAAPQTTIDSGPSGSTNNASPSFGFSSEAGASFECKLDGPGAATGSFAACTSPKDFTNLAEGTYTFSVRATDAAGNTDATPATRSFTLDTGAPQTAIASGPSGPTNNDSPSFDFSSTEAGSTFQCKLDGPAGAVGTFTACTSPKSYANLADGSYEFSVRAVDSGNNADATPAARSFTVDTAAPPAEIDSGPSGTIDDPTPTFAFSSNEPGAHFECKLDSAPFQACTSPFTTPALPAGVHTFEVRAIDSAGNVTAVLAQRTFTVTAAPVPTPTPSPTPTPTPGDADADAVPDATDNCPSTANANQADADKDGIGDACDQSDASPGPSLATTVVLRIVRGTVLIDTPGGSKVFVPLEGAAIVPLGSIVDTTHGRLALTSVGKHGKPQTAEFYDGIFQIKQKRAKAPITDLFLRAPGFKQACAAAGANKASIARRRSRKRVASLWGSGKGSFRTTGRHSAATVKGTIWQTQERCDGTLTRVKRGVVAVRDFRTKRTVKVRAGKQYLARP